MSSMQASVLRLLQHYYNHLFICCKCYYGCIIASFIDNVVIACSFLIDFSKSTFLCVMQVLSEKYEQTSKSRRVLDTNRSMSVSISAQSKSMHALDSQAAAPSILKAIEAGRQWRQSRGREE